MMLDHARKFLMLSLVAGAVPVTACVDMDEPVEDQSALDPAERAWLDDSTEDLEALEAAAGETPSCPNERFTVSDVDDLTTATSELVADDPESAALCGIDIYFHPNNGSHGGWIESWRLCYRGGNTYQICTGGYAPVRFWNPWACGGTVHAYYPQGWHGWAQTAGGCC
jgi:hypothetical protein